MKEQCEKQYNIYFKIILTLDKCDNLINTPEGGGGEGSSRLEHDGCLAQLPCDG